MLLKLVKCSLRAPLKLSIQLLVLPNEGSEAAAYHFSFVNICYFSKYVANS